MAPDRIPFAAPGTMLTVGQASQIVHVHGNTLRKWSDEGLIPSYRIGQRRDRWFDLEVLLDFLAADGNRGIVTNAEPHSRQLFGNTEEE